MANSGQRLKDSLDQLGVRQAGYSLNPNNPSLNLAHGGLFGALPNIAKIENGVVWGNWINNSPEVTGAVHVVLLDYPKGFDFTGSENSKLLRAKLSNFWTSHVETLEGIHDTTSWTFDDAIKIGGTGESIQDAVDAKLTPTEPSAGCTEKVGLEIRNIFYFINRYFIMDEYTQKPLAPILPNYDNRVPWTLDIKSFSILVWELDGSGARVKNAQIVANMMYKDGISFEYKKDPNSAKEVRKYNISFTGFGVRGAEVISVAQRYQDTMNRNTKDALLTRSLYSAPVDELAENVLNTSLRQTTNNL